MRCKGGVVDVEDTTSECGRDPLTLLGPSPALRGVKHAPRTVQVGSSEASPCPGYAPSCWGSR
jgi:hypothetical protein